MKPAGRSAASVSGAEALNAPLFASLLEQLHQAEQRCVVLDLGPARTETIAVFGQFRSRLDIADIADGVERLADELELDELQRRIEAMLPPPQEERANVILCWDLLNYVNRQALAALMTAVAERARPGAYAHALIAYSSSTMSARPGCYVPLDEQRLVNLAPAQAERPSPRYSPEDLTNCMPRYRVERARLLRNGMQEFLFRL